MKSLILILLLALALPSSSYKILVPAHAMVKSLSHLFATLCNHLAERGHEVHLITSYPPDYRHPNLKITRQPDFDQFFRAKSMFDMATMEDLQGMIKKHVVSVTNSSWRDPKIMEIWKERNTYDVILMVSYFYESNFPFLHNFTGQFVQFITPGIESISLSRQGNWLVPSTVPDIYMNFDDEMTFWERAQNLPIAFVSYLVQDNFAKFAIDEARKFFPDLLPYQRYYDRVDLSLINGHYALDGIVPLLPNQVEIGNINIQKAKKLPKDLGNFMDGAGDAGVIYFSLGSFVRVHEIPKHALAAFMEAFQRIPQRIVWKYDGEANLPPNIYTEKWMPQQDILRHPKVKVFISHCGNQGTQEAKYFGVPVLGVPIAFDQPRNAARMERKGLALTLTWDEITADLIVESLNKLINDTTYKKRIDQVSRILQDRKETPAELAVWWIEYIVRHKGAPQLEYAGKRMRLFQYIMLDVLAFWLTVLSAILFIFIKITKMICCRSSTKKEKYKVS